MFQYNPCTKLLPIAGVHEIVICPLPAVATTSVGILPMVIDVVSAGVFGSGEALTSCDNIERFPSPSSLQFSKSLVILGLLFYWSAILVGTFLNFN